MNSEIFFKNMKVVILSGGTGSRLGYLTTKIPKPMVEIGNFPILWHIINIYASQGIREFVIALGYKSEIIKKFFHSKEIFEKNKKNKNILKCKSLKGKILKINLVETGLKTMTGGRLLRLKNYLKEDSFMLTYGDGLGNVNILKLLKFHKKNKKIVTVTGVHPAARFGELNISRGVVKSFKEKPQVTKGWINGGFFVMDPKIFNYLKDDNTVLEGIPLEKLAFKKQLMAYLHKGFWHCMDTVRDKNSLEEIWRNKKNAPWKIW